MKKLVILTGAGMSAESGIRTFRESGGLWEEHDVYQVASPQGWEADPGLVLRFYNERRRQLLACKPNAAHLKLVELEKYFEVQIITQNVDNLHERAGSSQVFHLHGELMKARSTKDPGLVYEIEGSELNRGDTCELGSQLRPHVVWFGEDVPAIAEAAEMVAEAQLFAVIGTSLNVYPAAGLLDYVPAHVPKFLIDPADVPVDHVPNMNVIKEKAGKGTGIMMQLLMRDYS